MMSLILTQFPREISRHVVCHGCKSYYAVMVRNELIEEILKLRSTDREYVRDVVLASLTDELPPQLSPADRKEVRRRIREYDKNPSSFLSWKQVKKRLAAQRPGTGT
jgi:hypothetical protein